MTNLFPVLYVFVRNDLDSMNPGKAEAHSGHAASAFAKWWYTGKHNFHITLPFDIQSRPNIVPGRQSNSSV